MSSSSDLSSGFSLDGLVHHLDDVNNSSQLFDKVVTVRIPIAERIVFVLICDLMLQCPVSIVKVSKSVVVDDPYNASGVSTN